MRNRLTESDLSRIVRRVLKEEEDTSIGGGCFSNTTISIPSSCKVKTTGGMIGTGISVSQECISDLGAMMTMKNLTEVTKVLGCLAKHASTPIRY
jgi:hypothetical protein